MSTNTEQRMGEKNNKVLIRSIVLWISVLINIVTISVLITIVLREKEEYYQKCIRYTQSCDIAMFGDSNTEGGNWNSLIKNGLVLKKAFSGYTSGQLAGMISRTIKYHPKIVFIQAGANDVRSRCFSLEYTMSNLKFMADTLRVNHIIPVFQKLFYRQNRPEANIIIDSINASLFEYCQKENIDLIDIGKYLHDSTGLKADVTTDGQHLNAKGYKLWARVINEYLQK
jgi:lysophospholipase L1-like esterase